MSRNLTNSNALTNPVTTGAQVVAPMFTTTGFTAGDYVYQMTGGTVGTRQTGTVGVGADYAWMGGQLYTSYIATANYKNVSYGPFSDQSTYTGTTVTKGNSTISPVTINNTIAVNQCYKQSAILSNGNVVLVYSDSAGSGATLYFKIVDNTGATVVAETTVVSAGCYNTTASCNFSVCALNTGNFVVTWLSFPSTYTFYYRKYSNTGTLVTDSSASTPIASPYGHQSAGLANGGWVTTYVSNTNYGAPYFTTFAPGGGYAYGSLSHGCSCNSAPVVGLPTSLLASGATYGAFAIYTPDTTGSSQNMYVSVYNNNSEVAYAGLYSTNSSASYYQYSITVLSDNTIALLGPYGAVYIEKYTLSGSSLTRSVAYNVGTVVGIYGGYLIPSANAGCTLVGASSGLTNLVAMSLSSSNTGSLISSNYLSIYAQTQPQNYSIAGLANGSFMTFYYASASPYRPTITGTANQTLTNGVTVLTNANSYTPTNGYILQGVALTTASANSVGQVVVNGVAQLGSAYPTVTSPINFNYQNTGGQFAQKGTMSSTTVILKGLE